MKANADMRFWAMTGIPDLNRKRPFALALRVSIARSGCVTRQDAVRAGHGLPAVEDLSSQRRSLVRASPAPVHYPLPTMTKSELITRIAGRDPRLVVKDAEIAVTLILAAMSERLSQGGRIEIRRFGTFSLRYRPALVGRNPKSGTRLLPSLSRVTPSAVSEPYSELIGGPIARSVTTPCACLELRPLPSPA